MAMVTPKLEAEAKKKVEDEAKAKAEAEAKKKTEDEAKAKAIAEAMAKDKITVFPFKVNND